MQRLILPGQDLELDNDVQYQTLIRVSAKKQWSKAAHQGRLTAYFIFYIDAAAERRSILLLLNPILRGLRRIVYLHESQIDQFNACKVVRIPDVEKACVHVFFEPRSQPKP